LQKPLGRGVIFNGKLVESLPQITCKGNAESTLVKKHILWYLFLQLTFKTNAVEAFLGSLGGVAELADATDLKSVDF
jgi:hypothetical protein